MDIVELRNQLKSFIKEAETCEKSNENDKAKRMYEKAIKVLDSLIKCDQNKYNIPAYEKKKLECTEKMQEIDKKKVPVAEGGKDEKEDPDQKLKEQLSGCLVSETPDVKWDDVAGLEKAKEALKEAVILPQKFPQLFVGKRKPWKGILLYGPPGTGKSYLAKAAATETGGKFYSVSASNIVSKWMGESERLIKALFDLARSTKPAVIFLDEIDSIMTSRSDGENDATKRLKTEFLVQMQGMGNEDDGVLVLGATNIPWGLDPAVRRRFQKKIYITLPEKEARKKMFKLHLGNTENVISDEEFDHLAEITEGFSGSDISTLTQDAIYEPLRKCQSARFFKETSDGHTVPCAPSEPGAIKMTIGEITKPETLQPPKVCFEDYIKALQKIKPTYII